MEGGRERGWVIWTREFRDNLFEELTFEQEPEGEVGHRESGGTASECKGPEAGTH